MRRGRASRCELRGGVQRGRCGCGAHAWQIIIIIGREGGHTQSQCAMNPRRMSSAHSRKRANQYVNASRSIAAAGMHSKLPGRSGISHDMQSALSAQHAPRETAAVVMHTAMTGPTTPARRSGRTPWHRNGQADQRGRGTGLGGYRGARVTQPRSTSESPTYALLP